MRKLAYGRLGLAVILPVATLALLGLGWWHAEARLQAAQALQAETGTSIQQLQERVAEFAPGGPGYLNYIALLNSGFAAPATPADLHAFARRLAHQQAVKLESFSIGEAIPAETGNASLLLTDRQVQLTISSPNEPAVLAFIDALRRSGKAELLLTAFALQRESGTVTATCGLVWQALEGAPQVEYVATPLTLPEPLAGQSFFPASATAEPVVAAAPMLLQVERVKR